MKSRFKSVTSSIAQLLLVIFVLLVTLIFAIIQGGFLLWFVFFMLLPFMLYSCAIFFTPIKNFTVEREVESGRLQQGDALNMKVTLKRKSAVPIFFLVVQEINTLGIFDDVDEKLVRKIVPIGFKKEVSWTYPIEKLPRGRHELKGIQIAIADLLGWVRKTHYINAPKTIVVYPQTENVNFAHSMSHELGQLSSTNRKRLQHSTLVSSVREYAPGDRMTWLHWPSFAKTGQLHTKEFDYQQSEDTCVIFDSAKGYAFEGHVSLTASLMKGALLKKEPVCFLGAGEQRFAVESFENQGDLEKIMYYLATITPNKYDVRIKYERDDMIDGANALMLITSNLTDDWIELLAKNAKKGSVPVAYIVRPKRYSPSIDDSQLEQHAESRGVTIIYAQQGQFDSLNKGGIL